VESGKHKEAKLEKEKKRKGEHSKRERFERTRNGRTKQRFLDAMLEEKSQLPRKNNNNR